MEPSAERRKPAERPETSILAHPHGESPENAAPPASAIHREAHRPSTPRSWASGAAVWIYPLILALLLIAGWEAVVRIFAMPHYILPAPSEVAAVLVDKRWVFLHHGSVTALEVVAGGA